MRVLALTLLAAAAALAADTNPQLSQAQIDEIVQKFSAKESAFARARENYTYRQSAKIQEADDAGTPGGKWEEVSDIVFTGEGKRTEHVVRAPVTTLRLIVMDPGDLEDIRHTQPFVLTSEELPNYYVRYLGHQNVDEIGCYVFAVKPKKLESNKRYFSGQVWVDDRDLQIVKSYGRGVGLQKKSEDHQYPKFETYREQIDGKYWFPTYTIANDTLHFKENDVRIKQTIKYEDYKQFRSDVKITFGEEADTKPEVKDDKKDEKPAVKKKP
ncbi:MAG TPA: hypothetical protein VNX18_16525 [Bryobacteraceae bacterium]|nr:hypothetical protein [Bryobacteraceae bacterium]